MYPIPSFAISAIELTSAIPLFSRSASFNDLDPFRTIDPPLTWQLAQTFLKIVSPPLTSKAKRYLLCKKVWKIIIKVSKEVAIEILIFSFALNHP